MSVEGDRMRRSKIVVTLGPASASRERIRELIEAGMDVARLNFSHGTHADHAAWIALVRDEAARSGRSVGILQDLQGPKIRTGELRGDKPVQLKPGQFLTITTDPIEGDAQRISTSYEQLAHDVRAGDRILISDGLIGLRVQRTTATEVITEVLYGGELRPRQGIDLPGVEISTEAVTEKDLIDLHFGLEQGVDWIALSFVRRAEDLLALKRAIAEAGQDTPVIAKLEKPEALDALPEILQVSDGVMVARGDLGVEMPPERVPMAQKRIIVAANRGAIPVITATQMLQSMIEDPQPTRAEVSDVANAILDGSDAVMLSGETAVGSYPVEAVRMMARIAEAVEEEAPGGRGEGLPPWAFSQVHSIPEAIGAAVSAIVHDLPVRAVCVLTKTGSSARLVAQFRPRVPILAFTPFEATYRQLSLVWGVTPVLNAFAHSEEAYYRQVETILLNRGYAQNGDTVVLTGGHPIVGGGPTNLIKILVVGDEA